MSAKLGQRSMDYDLQYPGPTPTQLLVVSGHTTIIMPCTVFKPPPFSRQIENIVLRPIEKRYLSSLIG